MKIKVVKTNHEGVDGALVRLLARRGMDEGELLEPYLCGDGGSPGFLHNFGSDFFELLLHDCDGDVSTTEGGRDLRAFSLAPELLPDPEAD